MKTEFMAAAAACRLKARAFARACLESKGNPSRLFWTAATAIAMAVVIVPATTLLGAAAFAHDDPAGSGYQGSWHYGSYCNSEYRISHGDTDCMHAWWDNTPPISTGYLRGSTYGAQNKCVDYGAMMAAIDMESGRDEHFHMSNGDKKRGADNNGDVRSISCCLKTSDLCEKQQVVPVANRIKHYTSSPPNKNDYLYVRVDTHEARYNHCKDNPNSIYCEHDSEGDAFTQPLLCDGSLCTVDHCWEGWNDSRANNSCDNESMQLRDSNIFRPRCRVSASCPDDDDVSQDVTATYDMDTMPTLKNCDAKIQFWGC